MREINHIALELPNKASKATDIDTMCTKTHPQSNLYFLSKFQKRQFETFGNTDGAFVRQFWVKMQTFKSLQNSNIEV